MQSLLLLLLSLLLILLLLLLLQSFLTFRFLWQASSAIDVEFFFQMLSFTSVVATVGDVDIYGDVFAAAAVVLVVVVVAFFTVLSLCFHCAITVLSRCYCAHTSTLAL